MRKLKLLLLVLTALLIFGKVHSLTYATYKITIYNNQSSATPILFQQLLNITSSQIISPTIWNYITQYPLNITFYDSTGSQLYAWIENITPSYILVWVKIPNGIPANSNYTIYMNITNLNQYPYTGINPYLGNTTYNLSYGQYDNGANVFINYWNFAGTSLPSGWTYYNSLPTINNGVTLTASGQLIETTSKYPITNILEAYVQGPAPGGCYAGFGYLVDYYGNAYTSAGGFVNTGSSSGYAYNGLVVQFCCRLMTISAGSWTGFGGSALNGVTSIVSTGSVAYGYTNYNTVYSSTSNAAPSGAFYYIAIGSGCASSVNLYIPWIRTRAYPPNGVMPQIVSVIPQFSVSTNVSNTTLIVGQNSTVGISISTGLNSNNIVLSCLNLPQNISCSFNPNPITSLNTATYPYTASSILTLSANSTLVPGIYTITILANDTVNNQVATTDLIVLVGTTQYPGMLAYNITLTNNLTTNLTSFYQLLTLPMSALGNYGWGYLLINPSNALFVLQNGTILNSWYVGYDNNYNLRYWIYIPYNLTVNSNMTVYLELSQVSQSPFTVVNYSFSQTNANIRYTISNMSNVPFPTVLNVVYSNYTTYNNTNYANTLVYQFNFTALLNQTYLVYFNSNYTTKITIYNISTFPYISNPISYNSTYPGSHIYYFTVLNNNQTFGNFSVVMLNYILNIVNITFKPQYGFSLSLPKANLTFSIYTFAPYAYCNITQYPNQYFVTSNYSNITYTITFNPGFAINVYINCTSILGLASYNVYTYPIYSIAIYPIDAITGVYNTSLWVSFNGNTTIPAVFTWSAVSPAFNQSYVYQNISQVIYLLVPTSQWILSLGITYSNQFISEVFYLNSINQPNLTVCISPNVQHYVQTAYSYTPLSDYYFMIIKPDVGCVVGAYPGNLILENYYGFTFETIPGLYTIYLFQKNTTNGIMVGTFQGQYQNTINLGGLIYNSQIFQNQYEMVKGFYVNSTVVNNTLWLFISFNTDYNPPLYLYIYNLSNNKLIYQQKFDQPSANVSIDLTYLGITTSDTLKIQLYSGNNLIYETYYSPAGKRVLLNQHMAIILLLGLLMMMLARPENPLSVLAMSIAGIIASIIIISISEVSPLVELVSIGVITTLIISAIYHIKALTS